MRKRQVTNRHTRKISTCCFDMAFPVSETLPGSAMSGVTSRFFATAIYNSEGSRDRNKLLETSDKDGGELCPFALRIFYAPGKFKRIFCASNAF